MDYRKCLCMFLMLCVTWVVTPTLAKEAITCTNTPCVCQKSDVDCEQTCTKVGCAMTCTSRDTCVQTCSFGNCAMSCDAKKSCSSHCTSGGCSMSCKAPTCQMGTGQNMKDVSCSGDKCTVFAEGAKTTINCMAKEECTTTCTQGDCTVVAKEASKAKLTCVKDTNCEITCRQKSGDCQCLDSAGAAAKNCTIKDSAGNRKSFLYALISFPVILIFVLMN